MYGGQRCAFIINLFHYKSIYHMHTFFHKNSVYHHTYHIYLSVLLTWFVNMIYVSIIVSQKKIYNLKRKYKKNKKKTKQ